MAYISKEEAAQCRKAIRGIAKHYGFTASVRNRDYSSLEVSLTSGEKVDIKDLAVDSISMRLYNKAIDAGVDSYSGVEDIIRDEFGNHEIRLVNDVWNIFELLECKSVDINHFYLDDYFLKNSKFYKFFSESLAAAKKILKWYDNSDPMTDYFHTKAYFDFSIGSFDKPYKVK